MSHPKYFNMKAFNDCNAEICNDNHYYDLHNMADFIEAIYKPLERKTMLIWRYPGEWFLKDDATKGRGREFFLKNDIGDSVRLIALIFFGVLRFAICPRDPEMPFTEDNCLAQIYTYDEDNQYKDTLVFEFQSGMKVKIEAEEVHFERDYHKE